MLHKASGGISSRRFHCIIQQEESGRVRFPLETARLAAGKPARKQTRAQDITSCAFCVVKDHRLASQFLRSC